MGACWNHRAAQDLVAEGHLQFAAVFQPQFPSCRIPDLAEHQLAFRGGRVFIAETVGGVAGKAHIVCLKAVRALEPGVAAGEGIAQRSGPAVHYDIAAVEFGKAFEFRQGRLRLLHAPHSLQGLGQLGNLPLQMVLDVFLVYLQFGRGVSTYVLVPERRMRVVEHVHGEIQHPVRRVGVRQDGLVRGPLVELRHEVLRSDEVVGVQISLAHGEHVHKHQSADAERGCDPAALVFAAASPDEQAGAGHYHDERQQGVAAHQGDAVRHQRIHQRPLHAGVGSTAEAARKPWKEPEQKADSAGKSEGEQTLLPQLFGGNFTAHESVEEDESQQRHGHLQHAQGHGHRPEFVVEGQVVVAQLGKPHEMMPESEEDREQRSREQPPAFLAFQAEESEKEEEDGDAADEHGACGEGLGPPVKRKLLADLLETGLPGALQQFVGLAFGTQRACRRSSVEVGYHQVGKFLPTVAPGRGIVEVQALGFSRCRPSAHGVGSVFEGREQLGRVSPYPRKAQHQEKRGNREESPYRRAALPVGQQPDEHGNHIESDDQREIVGYLRMVGLDLKTDGKTEQCGPQQGLRQFFRYCGFIGEHQRRQHPGHQRNGLHLRIVAYLDYLEIERAEGDGHRTSRGDQGIYPEREQQQEASQHRHEQPVRRAFARHQALVERPGPVSLGGSFYGSGGHAPEHRLRPCGFVVGMLLVPPGHLLRHAPVARDVRLVDDFAPQHLRNETVSQHQKTNDYPYVDYQFLFHIPQI